MRQRGVIRREPTSVSRDAAKTFKETRVDKADERQRESRAIKNQTERERERERGDILPLTALFLSSFLASVSIARAWPLTAQLSDSAFSRATFRQSKLPRRRSRSAGNRMRSPRLGHLSSTGLFYEAAISNQSTSYTSMLAKSPSVADSPRSIWIMVLCASEDCRLGLCIALFRQRRRSCCILRELLEGKHLPFQGWLLPCASRG